MWFFDTRSYNFQMVDRKWKSARVIDTLNTEKWAVSLDGLRLQFTTADGVPRDAPFAEMYNPPNDGAYYMSSIEMMAVHGVRCENGTAIQC